MIKYFVDKDNGVVVARFMTEEGYTREDEREYWVDSLWGYVDNLQRNTALCIDGRVMAREIVYNIDNLAGKAKLYPGDTFDEEKGKQIAKERLITKFYRAKERLNTKLKKMILRDIELLTYKMG